jgi:hypothetical protein
MKTLFIFDFDDTLALTNSHVVINDKLRLNSREFAKYRAKPDDILDFSEFEDVKSGSLIQSSIDAMESAITDHGFENVFIVTARAIAPPVKRFLESMNVTVPKIIATSGSANKARWLVRTLYMKEYDKVMVYEDCKKNIKMLNEVVEQFNIENDRSIEYSSVCVVIRENQNMYISKPKLREVIRKIILETRHGRKAARTSMERMRRKNRGYDVDEEDRLQDMYSDIDDYFDGGYDEDSREWIVYDEVEGKFVGSGVSEKGPIGKMKAYHNVNGRESVKHKASQKAMQYYYG